MHTNYSDIEKGYMVKDPYRKIAVNTGWLLLAVFMVVSVVSFAFAESFSAAIFVVMLAIFVFPALIWGMWINTQYVLSSQGIALIPHHRFSKRWKKSFTWDEIVAIYPSNMVFRILYKEHNEKYLEFRKGNIRIPQEKRMFLAFWEKENNAICIPWSEDAIAYVKKYWNKDPN